MPRKKKTGETSKQESKFIYCELRKCPHYECLRHHINEPWNILILEKKFEPDKDWNCKDIVED